MLTVHTDWSWHRWDHLYGTLTYLGLPAFGFLATSVGNPLDGFGRNVYVDTYDSAYGQRLAPREQRPHAQGNRRLLLQRQPARRASRRQGRASTG